MNKQKWRKVKGLGWVKSTWNKASVCEYLRMQCLCTTVKSCLSPASSWQHLLRFLMHFRFSGPSTASKANDTVKPSRYRFCPKTKRCPVEPLKKTWRRGLLDYSVSKRFNRKKICFFLFWFWTSLAVIRSINLHPARRSFYLGASKKIKTHGKMVADKCGKWSASRVCIALSRNRVLPELTGALDSPFPEFSHHLIETDLTDKIMM